MDRGFRVTGGACQLASVMEGTGGATEFVTGQACKAVGGQWRGGHDISGHVFILVLGSLFLGLEVLPAMVGAKGLREERMVRGRDGGVGRVEREAGGGEVGEWKTGIGAPLVVAGLSWWMLLMTAAYFHTWFEKVMSSFPFFATLMYGTDICLVHGTSDGFGWHFRGVFPSASIAGHERHYRHA